MVLGNEVVAKNDPENESKSVDDLITEILAQKPQNENTDTISEKSEIDDGAAEENNNSVVAVDEVEAEAGEVGVAKEEEAEEEEELVPPAEEEEEEEDLVDPVDAVREKCEQKASCQKYFEKLEECNNRVNSRSNTSESCHEEMMDWIHAVDHCVAHNLFSKIK